MTQKHCQNWVHDWKNPVLTAIAMLLWEQDAAGSNPVSPMPQSPVPEGNLSHPQGWLFYWLRGLARKEREKMLGLTS